MTSPWHNRNTRQALELLYAARPLSREINLMTMSTLASSPSPHHRPRYLAILSPSSHWRVGKHNEVPQQEDGRHHLRRSCAEGASHPGPVLARSRGGSGVSWTRRWCRDGRKSDAWGRDTPADSQARRGLPRDADYSWVPGFVLHNRQVRNEVAKRFGLATAYNVLHRGRPAKNTRPVNDGEEMACTRGLIALPVPLLIA